MNQIFKRTLLASSVAMTLAIAPTANATNGLAPVGLGQIHKGMGGAAVGNPQNTTSMMTNPAAASFVPDGWDAAAELFKPNRTVISKTGFGEFKGDKASVFFIPEAAYKRDKGKYSIGITTYGNGGMNTSFPTSPQFPSSGAPGAPPAGTPIPFNGGAPSTTGIDLKQLFISPTISVKINDKQSVGLSANLVYQRFHATGLQAIAPNSGSPANFTDVGTDTSTGIGATVGWMGKMNDKLTLGASYRFKTSMSKFDDYKGLFPNAGKLDVPAALTIGGSFKITPATTVAVDIQRIYYSKLAATGNSSQIMLPFGSYNGPGFGWDDQDVYKIGVKHQTTPKLAITAGYNHGDSPLGPEDTFFGALTPAVVEDHLALGFEYNLSKSSSLIGSYIHTFSNTVNGDLALGQPFDLKMDQDAIGLGYSKKF